MLKLTSSRLKILDFDIENRPLTYLGGDFTTCEVTAIAASFDGVSVESWVLGEDHPAWMLEGFRTMYDQADIVTGHYIIKHDLPTLQGAMLEFGFDPLPPKLVSDTYADLISIKGVSKSQESLSAMLGVRALKVGMSQADWREANRLTPEGIMKTRARVTGDVLQHIAMRAELLRRGMLRSPRPYDPSR